MNKPMKHRLIGSLFWLALAAIIFPFFMNGEGLKDIPQIDIKLKDGEIWKEGNFEAKIILITTILFVISSQENLKRAYMWSIKIMTQ